MGSSRDWHATALEIYRIAFREVTDRWSRLNDVRGEYLCDELRESLFDLKQSVIEDNQVQYLRAVAEVYELLNELLLRYPEQP